MKLLRAMAVTGLAVTLSMVGQTAFAQYNSGQYGNTQANREGTYSAETSNWGTAAEAANPASTNQQGWNQAREVKREINEARSRGIDTADAEYFDQRGRQELDNGDYHMARTEFNRAQTALDNAGFQGATAMKDYNEGDYNNGDNWGNYHHENTSGSTSAWNQEQQIRADIDKARSEGIDVADPQYYENRGRQALENGDTTTAQNYFNKARAELGASGLPVAGETSANQRNEWGDNTANSNAEGYNNEGQHPERYNTGSYAGFSGANGSGWSEGRQVSREIDQARSQGIDVSDAQYFEQRGHQALENGNSDKAATYFDEAESALQDAGFQTNQTYGNYNSHYNGMNNQAAEGTQQGYNQTGNAANQNRWSESAQVHHEIDQAQAQGINVNDAIYYEMHGNDALRSGDSATAGHDFSMAENALAQQGLERAQTDSQQAYNQMGR
jgi:hypothetical protein